MSGEKTVWVSRSPGMEVVVVTDYEPYLREGMNCFDYRRDKPFLTFGLYSFEAVIGLTIKPGQCLRIRLTAEVMEGEDGNGN